MQSEFISVACGRLLHLDIETGSRVYTMDIIKYRRSAFDDGYWNSELMLAQVIIKAIPIVEKAYPDYIAVFAFDNSSGHACKAENALVASRMNLNPSGKQPLMWDTTITSPGPDYPLMSHVKEHMVFQPGDYDVTPHLLNISKAIKHILQEKCFWIAGLQAQCPSLRKIQSAKTEEQYITHVSAFQSFLKGGSCCTCRIMESQPDILAEKSHLEIEIKKCGDKCIFYPRLHSNLNYNNFYWGKVDGYTGEDCNYSVAELEVTVLHGLDCVSHNTIHCVAHWSHRWIVSYISSLNEPQK